VRSLRRSRARAVNRDLDPSPRERRENPAILFRLQPTDLVLPARVASGDVVARTTTLLSINSLQTVSGSFNHPTGLLFIFRSRYLFAIGLPSLFSFRWNAYHPLCAAIPNNATLDFPLVRSRFGDPRGCHPLWRCFPTDLVSATGADWGSQTTIRTGVRFRLELFPLHSQLLREELRLKIFGVVVCRNEVIM